MATATACVCNGDKASNGRASSSKAFQPIIRMALTPDVDQVLDWDVESAQLGRRHTVDCSMNRPAKLIHVRSSQPVGGCGAGPVPRCGLGFRALEDVNLQLVRGTPRL